MVWVGELGRITYVHTNTHTQTPYTLNTHTHTLKHTHTHTHTHTHQERVAVGFPVRDVLHEIAFHRQIVIRALGLGFRVYKNNDNSNNNKIIIYHYK